MDIKKLRKLTVQELVEVLKKTRRSLAVKRFHLFAGKGGSTAELSKDKKTIARALTLLNNQK